MAKYTAYKSEAGLVIHYDNQNYSKIDKEEEAFLINCDACSSCEASALDCSSLYRNDDICKYILENFTICKNNSRKLPKLSKKKMSAIPICCDFKL